MEYKIRECREEAGLSQEELAKRAKISRTTLSGLESGAIKTTTTGKELPLDVDRPARKHGAKAQKRAFQMSTSASILAYNAKGVRLQRP